MPATYEPIATTTLGSTASTITFSSIPSTYTDLRLVFVGKVQSAATDIIVRFNSNTSTVYSSTRITGDGASASAGRQASANHLRISNNSLSTTVPSFGTIDLFSYTAAIFKTSLSTYSQDLNGSGQVERTVGLYRSTTAISTIELIGDGSNFSIGTTATLYGILKA